MPSTVHFLHLHEGPETYRLTAAIKSQLQLEISRPAFHFSISRERSSPSDFLALCRVKEQPSLSQPNHEVFLEKKIQFRGTDLGPAYQKLLPCLLDYAERFPMSLTDLPAHTPRRFLYECLLNGHWLYLLLERQEDRLCQASLFVKSLPNWIRKNVRTILMAGRKPMPKSLRTLEDRLGTRIRHVIRPDSSDLHIPEGSRYRTDCRNRHAGQIRRIAREIGRCRMGLVLSSGGAKGFAHVGVIQVLEELGLEFDLVAGSSFGAVVGALWARGFDGAQLEDIALDFKSRLHLLKIIDHVVDIRRGLIRGHRMEKYIRKLLGSASFSQLSLPLAVTATDIQSLQSTLIDDGDVASALHASSAIPGICIPCKREGHLYIDGGVANPLPVQALRKLGIEHIVAVSTVLTRQQGQKMGQHRVEAEAAFARNHPVANFLNKRLNLFAQGNAFDTLMRSIEAAHVRLVERDTQMADLVLQPLPHDSRWQDFTQPGKYVEAGRKTTTAKIEALLAVETVRRKGLAP